MKKRLFIPFGSEWFGIPISTLALAQVYLLIFGREHGIVYRYIGEGLTFTGLLIFAIIFVMWVVSSLSSRGKKHAHWENLTRLSFIALIPIVGFVGNAQLLSIFGINSLSAGISLFDFYVFYGLSLVLGVLLGYRLYTKEIAPREINYAIVIPPLAIGTNVFLAPYVISYYGGVESQAISFLVIMGLGIFFFLYIFIGSLALSAHVSTKMHESLPTTMLPVGIASLIVLNLFTISGFDSPGALSLSIHTVSLLSIMLWGFEVWNFLVVLIIIFARPSRGNLSVWAYGFPLGLFATSTLKIMTVVNFRWMFWIFIAIAVMLNILWVYGWINTVLFVGMQSAKARS
ncbi:MAG: C4-dicarboxylate ABC transporter [Thermoplasmataceae archaeon]|jgi:tellurite resistance protein TehA-like permease